MASHFTSRFRTWLAGALTYEAGHAVDATTDAKRWEWLPALSGVAVGAEHARQSHAESRQGPNGMSA